MKMKSEQKRPCAEMSDTDKIKNMTGDAIEVRLNHPS